MHKNYRFSKKKEGTVLITVGGTGLKVQFDSSKKQPCMMGGGGVNDHNPLLKLRQN